MMAGGEALWHVRVTLLLLGLEVSLFLSAWSLDEHSQHHSLPEVVTPLKVSGTGKSVKASGWLSYSLHFGGQRHIVHMKVKKSFLARNLPVFTYTEQGALLDDQPFIPSDCYYHGYVDGDPESLVVLSTCFGGFQGILQVKDITYEIRPKMFSGTFEHLVYKMDSEETQFSPLRCGLTEEEIERQLKFQGIHNFTLMQSAYEGWWTHQWFVELAIVVDKIRYETLQRNETLVQQEVFNVVNIMSTLYEPLQIGMALYGIEIWTEKNVFALDDIDVAVREFCSWKRKNLAPRIHHDFAHLIVNSTFGRKLGTAYVGTICNGYYNCAVLSFTGKNLVNFGLIIAHELGHNLGMLHDNERCRCAQKKCIMWPTKTTATKFSNCSYGEFWNTNIKARCLRNPPNQLDMREKLNVSVKQCGNNVVEEGEQCDCGALKSCNGDPCCMTNCKLKPGAVCAFGLCCENCKFASAGKLCRAKVNDCDLPEWCTGSSYHCPEDVYVQEGTPCLNGGFCFKKKCTTRDEQCRNIFGTEARSANKSCYKEMNTKGDRFGHCGIKNNEYVKCSISDILCGRVQCENVSSIPVLGSHSTVHRTPISDVTCWGTDYHYGMSIPDIGDVEDGTECGPENICLGHKCVNISLLDSSCTLFTCNNSGVCNNKEHCHCNDGWAPPTCRRKGSGGSLDSGPPPDKNGKEKLKTRDRFLPLYLITLLALLLCSLRLLWLRKKEKGTSEEINIS